MLASRVETNSALQSNLYSSGHRERASQTIPTMKVFPKVGRRPVSKSPHFLSSASKVSFVALLLFNIAIIISVFRQRSRGIVLPYQSKNIADFLPQGTVQINGAAFNLSLPPHRVSSERPSVSLGQKTQQKKKTSNKNRILFRTKTQGELESSWNRIALLDPSESEHIFTLQRMDHVSVFKPLCFRVSDGVAFTTTNNAICSGPLQVYKWLRFFCTTARKSVHRELHLDIHHSLESSKLNSSTVWIEETTALLVLDQSCSNVAHFAGRVMMLHHVLFNAKAYTGTPRIERIIVLPSISVSRRLDDAHVSHWHHSVLSAIVAPAKLTVTSFQDFLNVTNRQPRNSKLFSTAHVIDDLLLKSGMKSEGNETKVKYVCFRKSVVPGFLKGRFFVGDDEYPSTAQGWGQSVDGSVEVPRDSEELRRRIMKQIGTSEQFTTHEKTIVFLNRMGSRRVFDEEGQRQILGMVNKVAVANRFSFQVVSFEGMTFIEQVNAVRAADIAIGIHGANLVNTLFMEALSVLIEIMPFGFKHEMYKNGGNAGLKYFVHHMSQGKDYESLDKFESVEECIGRDQLCKVYYRDAIQRVSQRDLVEVQKLLEAAIAWCVSQ